MRGARQLHTTNHKIQSNRKCLALTFDDGPDAHDTQKVLDILREYGVKATFFCIGEQVEQYPDVVQRMVDAGHIVGNHTWSHPYLTKETWENVQHEIERTSDAIENVCGLRPQLFRPPYGDTNHEVDGLVAHLGYRTVLWDIDSQDWSGISGPNVAANVLPNLKPGSIILHHCAGHVSGTMAALPYIIEIASGMGYEFVTLPALIGGTPYQALENSLRATICRDFGGVGAE